MPLTGSKQLGPEGSTVDADTQRDGTQLNDGPSTGSDAVNNSPFTGSNNSPAIGSDAVIHPQDDRAVGSSTVTAVSLTTPTPIRAPISLLSSDQSPQRAFLGINELVTEVVCYLSSSHKEVVNCLYVCKSFHAAAIPFVYRYIPVRYINTVDPLLKQKYLGTIIAPSVDSCRSLISTVQPATHYPILIQAEGQGSSTGWVSISGPQTNVLVHASSNNIRFILHLLVHMESRYSAGTISVPVSSTPSTKTLTLVFVPTYISGQHSDSDNLFPFAFFATRMSLASTLALHVVGLEYCDPFRTSSSWKTQNAQPRFLEKLVRSFDFVDGETFQPESVETVKERFLSRIKYTTFKDYLETTSEWKNVLGWRKVGEWLNKYDERERKDGVEHTPMDHLPGVAIKNNPPTDTEQQ